MSPLIRTLLLLALLTTACAPPATPGEAKRSLTGSLKVAAVQYDTGDHAQVHGSCAATDSPG